MMDTAAVVTVMVVMGVVDMVVVATIAMEPPGDLKFIMPAHGR